MAINTLTTINIQSYPEGIPKLPANSTKIKISDKAKVIAFSMHTDKRYLKGMFEAGAFGYQFKNCTSNGIIKNISFFTSNTDKCRTGEIQEKQVCTDHNQISEIRYSLNLLISKAENNLSFDQLRASFVKSRNTCKNKIA